jgi:hypothetical protein
MESKGALQRPAFRCRGRLSGRPAAPARLGARGFRSLLRLATEVVSYPALWRVQWGGSPSHGLCSVADTRVGNTRASTNV